MTNTGTRRRQAATGSALSAAVRSLMMAGAETVRSPVAKSPIAVRRGEVCLGWYDVLWAIYREPDRRLRINELAREVVLSPTGMSRFVDRLEAAGAVRRESVPGDRRAFHVVITDHGIELLRRMWPIYAAGIEWHFARYLDDNAIVARTMLERMADSAREDAAKPT